MPYKTYGTGENQKVYWVDQTKNALPFSHGFAPNSANFVRNLLFHECSIPFQVYVETFLPSFLEMLFFITVPFFDDILRSTAEELAEEGAKATRRKSHFRQTYKLPEPATKAQRVARQGLKTVLRLTQPLETIGYVFLLYAGTEKFFYNWNSALYNFEHCGKPPSEGPLQRHSNAQGLPVNPGGEPLFMNIVDQNRANWSTSNQLVAVPRGHYQVTVEATFKSRAISPSQVQIYIIAGLSIPYDSYESGYVTLPAHGEGSCVLSTHVYFPLLTGGTIQWAYQGDAVPVGIDIESCSVSVYSFQPGR